MRRSGILVLLFALLMTVTAPAVADEAPSDVIALPDGFFPEGIAVGEGSTAYVGSLADGAIWKGDLATGEGDIFVAGVEGKLAVGMSYDSSTGYLYVAGGPDGNAYVYDGDTGDAVAVVNLVPFGFVNDVIVTRRAAYFTNSFANEIYELPLTPSGEIAGPSRTIPMSADFPFAPGEFNANGIEATNNGRTLIVVNSFFGEIYTVDPATGDASQIDLGGDIVNGDGLLINGLTLYAVEGGKNQITKILLASDLANGTVVDALESDAFDVPTTAARYGTNLYAVNAKFNTPPLPTTPYEIVRVGR